MIILAIDDAKKTGLALWDTESEAPPITHKITVADHLYPEKLAIALRAWTSATPDYIIMEHPFYRGEGKGSIVAYNTQIKILHAWEQAIAIRYNGRFKFRLEQSGRVNHRTKARLVWPSTWESNLTKGILVKGQKAKNKMAALRKWPDLPTNLTHDEYDACCLALWQWYMCRPITMADARKQRTMETMRKHGRIILTPEEVGLFR